MPSPIGAANGITKLWIDETLIYTLTNIKGPPTGYTPWTNNITYIIVHPSDAFWDSEGAKPPFHHGFDDITAYEGYVQPGDGSSDTTPPAAPQGLSVS